MALVVKDRVQETTTTVGTGTVTLGGAVLGFQTFAIIGNANQTYYTITDPTTGDYEVGIGTYTSLGTTLSRTTVLESSNSGSLVNFAAGTKNVFCTYPAERAVYLDTAGSAVTVLDIGTLGASTANITTANITSGTISTAPTSNTDIVNKQYADAIASGIHFHEAVALATTAALPANTYNNGTSGVGATLTATANGALSVDSTLTIVAERILVKNEVTGANNGVYVVTQVGTAGTPYILTRATDFDTVGTGVGQIDEGDFFLVTGGTANINTAWVQQTAPPITVGTTALVFQQFSAPITYTAGTGLSESPSYTFNIANTGTAGTYGGAASVPVFTTNAQGQVTSVTPTGIAIASGAVSGLAASATTDTTNASNISSGTLGTSRLSGSYTGITGTGALAEGSLATGFTAVSAPLGGTGQTSYAVGDLLYASTTTALSKLADVAVGNALISGGVGAAPSYGKIGLATHVSGTLPVANGGTGVTASTGTGSVVLSTSPSLTTPTIGSAGATFSGATSGTTVFKAAAVAGTTTITMPGTTGTVALTSDIPTVNNATLTMNVSGTGLSGSQTFTANQSSAATFTVTSNATSANTASAIVARGASGEFTSGDVTTQRPSAPTTGYIYFGNTGTRYIGYDGTNIVASVSPSFSITGNAATATTAGSITSQANSATITASTAANANQIVLRDGSGDDFRRYGFGSYFNSSDDVSAGTITYVMAKFGDNYYRSATAAKVAAFISGQSIATTGNVSGTNTVNKSFNASNAVIGNGTGGLNTLEILGTGNAAMMTFHRPGAFAGYFGLDSDNVWKVGGWSYGGVSYPLLYSGSSTAPGSTPVYAARCWVNFTPSSGAVVGSGNVSSVTRVGLANYTVNFSTAFTDANYAVVGFSQYQRECAAPQGTKTTTSHNMNSFANPANGVQSELIVGWFAYFR